MAELSVLLCDEKSKDLCFFDDDDEITKNPSENYCYDYDDDDDDGDDDNQSRSGPLVQLPEQSDEGFVGLLERENEFLLHQDYLIRLRSGDLDLAARTEAFDWIFKAHSYYSFGPLSLCLAVNYLDRFYSVRELPRDKAWTVQLLAVACLSIAAKVEETSMPQSIELQVGDPKYVFEAKTIQRMELLVLDTLKWKMNAVTPCSFLDYSLKRLSDPHSITDRFLFSTTKVVNRSMQLILCTIKGIDYLEFKPSEIAAGIAISVSAEIQAVDIDKATSCFIHLEKGRVMKCVELIKEMSQISRNGIGGSLGFSPMQQGVPHSPIGVLDAGCFSYKSDDLTSAVGSCSNSSRFATTTTITSTTTMTTSTTTTPGTKRMRLDPTSRLDS